MRKHPRDIDLSVPVIPSGYIEHDPSFYNTIASLAEWEVLGCKCAACSHVGWVNKDAVKKILGNQYLLNLRGKFTCACGNKAGNKVLIGRLPRNM